MNIAASIRRLASGLALAAAAVRPAEAAPTNAAPRIQAECTVILQTRPDRLYCYATNRPFRVVLREPVQFAHGEVFVAEGSHSTALPEDVPTLSDATITRLGRTNLPPARRVVASALTDGSLNFHRVAVRGRVESHEWMYFLNRHIEIVVVRGEGRPFRVNVLREFSDARTRFPVGAEVEIVGLSFLETFAKPRGIEVQVDVENLDECRVLQPPPWLTLEKARLLAVAGGLVVLFGVGWAAREHRQITRLRLAERAVRQLNTDLEGRIGLRTAELQSANARLRQAEQELLRSLATEKELGQLKTRFVSMVSHEFRNPLGIIMSSADILTNYLEELPEAEREEHLGAIHDAAARMARLMEEVLLLGRVDAGRVLFDPKPLDLPALCERIANDVAAATSNRCPITIRVQNTGGAVGDARLMGHILANLLSNGVKFSPAGREVQLNVRREGAHAVLAVADRGIGIQEADRAQLFEAFFRGGNAGDVPGTGLGLVIARRCAELHRGSITVSSREGGGTTFEVRLPLFES